MKFFGAVFAVVGCVVGIGFVSGKELAVFFEHSNPLFVSVTFFVLFFAVTLLFFVLGKKTGADADRNKTTFLSFMSIDDAFAYAKQLTEEAKDEINIFENHALLSHLADYLLSRDK